MAKVIKYDLSADGEPQIGQVVFRASIVCKTQEVFDANYPIAEKEAIHGSIEVIGEFDTDVSGEAGA